MGVGGIFYIFELSSVGLFEWPSLYKLIPEFDAFPVTLVYILYSLAIFIL